MVLDGLRGDKQDLGDLSVAVPGGGELGDPQLAGGERSGSAEQCLTPRSRTGYREPDARAIVQGERPSGAGEIRGPSERRSVYRVRRSPTIVKRIACICSLAGVCSCPVQPILTR